MKLRSDHPIELLRELQEAVQSGDREQLLLKVPEPPEFLPALFTLKANDRDQILTAVFSVLETDEDRWELIEAAAMHSITHSEQSPLLSLLPYIPQELREDLHTLLESLPSSEGLTEAHRALNTDLSR